MALQRHSPYTAHVQHHACMYAVSVAPFSPMRAVSSGGKTSRNLLGNHICKDNLWPCSGTCCMRHAYSIMRACLLQEGLRCASSLILLAQTGVPHVRVRSTLHAVFADTFHIVGTALGTHQRTLGVSAHGVCNAHSELICPKLCSTKLEAVVSCLKISGPLLSLLHRSRATSSRQTLLESKGICLCGCLHDTYIFSCCSSSFVVALEGDQW